MGALIIFDIGGVLRDSSQVMLEGYKRGIAQLGLEMKLSAKEVWRLRGLGKYNSGQIGAKAILAIAKSKANFGQTLEKDNAEELLDKLVDENIAFEDHDNVEKIYATYRTFFNSPEAAKQIHLFADAQSSIQQLRDNGFVLAIFTNASRLSIKRDLAKIGLENFSAIMSEEDVVRKKPCGEGIVKIMDKLRMTPNLTYYVGDAPTDIIAAKDAKCKAIALLTGMGSRENLEAEKPDMIFDNLSSMSEYLIANK